MDQNKIDSGSSPLYPYKAIHLIIISWAEDDLNIDSELWDLYIAFASLNFPVTTTTFSIPSCSPYHALTEKLISQEQNAFANDALLIVYYGGHGRLTASRRLRIAATSEPESPTLDWSAAQVILETARVDVFLILDCCNASAAAGSFDQESEGSPTLTNRFEILAGCGFDACTRGAGRYSFTNALTAELKKQGENEKGCVFSVAQLHQWLHAKMLRQHPSNIPDSDKTEWQECFVAPIYLPRCTDYDQTSILLRSLSKSENTDQNCVNVQQEQYLPGIWGSASTLVSETASTSNASTGITTSPTDDSITNNYNSWENLTPNNYGWRADVSNDTASTGTTTASDSGPNHPEMKQDEEWNTPEDIASSPPDADERSTKRGFLRWLSDDWGKGFDLL